MGIKEKKGSFRRAVKFYLNKFPILANGPHQLYIAIQDGRPAARILTGVDEVCFAQTGKKNGYFSMFDAEGSGDIVGALLRVADDFQRSHGTEGMIGPIPLDSYAFCYGLLVDGFARLPAPHLSSNPAFYAEILAKCDYVGLEDYLCFSIDMEGVRLSRLENAGERALRRFDLVVAPAGWGGVSATTRYAREVLERDGQGVSASDIHRALRSLKGLLDPRYLLVVFRSGRPVGFLFAYRSGVDAHVFTVHVNAEDRLRGAYVALASTFIATARRDGVKTIHAAVISAKNLSSRHCAQSVGGRVEHVYRVYHKQY